jgi:hypothetical protein
MVSLYQFEETPCLSSRYPVPALRVHAAAGCGRAFNDVAAILEPDSPNPCLLLDKPLGVEGVQTILNLLNERKQRAEAGADDERCSECGGDLDDDGNCTNPDCFYGE